MPRSWFQWTSRLLPLAASLAALTGCGGGEDVHADLPVDGAELRIEYRVHQAASPPYDALNWDIRRKSYEIPKSMKAYFGDFGTVGWWTNPERWVRDTRFQTGFTLEEMRGYWQEIRTKGSGFILVCATGRMYDDSGNAMIGQYGITPDVIYPPGSVQFYQYCFIFQSTIENSAERRAVGSPFYDYVVAHELGHAIAGLAHPNDPNYGWCHAENHASLNWCTMWDNAPIEPVDPARPWASLNLRNIVTERSFCNDEADASTCVKYLKARIGP